MEPLITDYFRCLCLSERIYQDAKRAKNELIALAQEHGHKIAAFYVENELEATLERPKLMQLIAKKQVNTQILKYSNTQILKYSNTQILKYSNTQNYFERLY